MKNRSLDLNFAQQLEWDEAFIGRHNVSGPRYTSYPTALQFHEEFSVEHYLGAIKRSNQSQKPLSIYVHLPFCDALCYYCACNKVITRSADRKRQYLNALIQEIHAKAALVEPGRPVYQMHWGGGTPTSFSDAELTELWFEISRSFHLVDASRGEYSIEIDPRTVSADRLALLKGLGFNRVSLGIQDFNPQVQQAIHREQSREEIANLVTACRDLHYRSINFDLIYGLPHQTSASVLDTVNEVIELAPDRVSLFNYAHLPDRFRAQRLLQEEFMPSPREKLKIQCAAAAALTKAGYHYVGMDHFAKPEDELAVAQANGRLHRNFQGYTTCKDADLLGLGVSAISLINDSYCQNAKSVSEYQERVFSGNHPVTSGVVLTRDDEIRRFVIMSLLCQNKLEPQVVANEFGIAFADYFSAELPVLDSMIEDDLLGWVDDTYWVTPKGRVVVRKICMLFDNHLPNHVSSGRSYSKVI